MNQSKAPHNFSDFGNDPAAISDALRHSPVQTQPLRGDSLDLPETAKGNVQYGDNEMDAQLFGGAPSLKELGHGETFRRGSDDLMAERGPDPTVQVDYLSHSWEESDIWSSWRYVRKGRGTCSGMATRLENASWRTWAQCRANLKMVSPRNLNWHGVRQVFANHRLKESDVTWLYGPFHRGRGMVPSGGPRTRSALTAHAVASPRPKPILKRRTESDIILGSLLRKRHSLGDGREIRNEQLTSRLRFPGTERQHCQRFSTNRRRIGGQHVEIGDGG